MLGEVIGHIEAQELYYNIQSSKIFKVDFNKTKSIAETEVKKGECEVKYDRVTPCRRKDGRWEIKKTVNGIRQSFYGKTQQECIKKYKEFKKSKQSNMAKPLTLYTALDGYLSNLEGDALKTYTATVTLHIKPVIKDKRLTSFNEDDIRQVLNQADSERIKLKIYTVLKNVLDKAERQRHIKFNPIEEINRPKCKQKRGEALTLEEEQILLREIKAHRESNAVIRFLLYSGCRRGEAYAAKWDDIDECANTLHIRGTKTDTSDRIIPLYPKLKTFLKELPKINEYILPQLGDKSLPYRYLKKILPNHKLHDLRHTFATRALEQGIPMKIVQQWLGHSNFSTTADIYSHVTDKASQDFARLLDDNFDDKNS